MTRWLALLALALAVAGCGGDTGPAATPGTVTELRALDELVDAVAADEQHARLVLLLSPT